MNSGRAGVAGAVPAAGTGTWARPDTVGEIAGLSERVLSQEIWLAS
jgi:PDZ domain-containing secreted protein